MSKIFIAGDSTAANKQKTARPETGWGEKIADLFNEEIQIENHAVNGRSTKSFLAEGRLEKIAEELQEGDYLFVQFGHNDQKIENPERYTESYGTYQENLAQFLEAARENGAQLVCLTSVTRRDFDENGRLNTETLGDYPQAMRDFAAENKLPLLDIFAVSQEWLAEMNPEEAKSYYLHLAPGEFANYPDGKTDDTHFSEKGARQVAEFVAAELLQSDLELKKFLHVNGKEIEK